MFEMFRGGKPDPMTLMAINYEERRSELDRVAKYIRATSSAGLIDVDEKASQCGVYNITPAEANYIEQRINAKW